MQLDYNPQDKPEDSDPSFSSYIDAIIASAFIIYK